MKKGQEKKPAKSGRKNPSDRGDPRGSRAPTGGKVIPGKDKSGKTKNIIK